MRIWGSQIGWDGFGNDLRRNRFGISTRIAIESFRGLRVYFGIKGLRDHIIPQRA
jgi:hypothetical protein